MTLLGKILVLVNFGLSVMVLVWAMTLYFYHIDWTDAKGEPNKTPPVPPGELKVRKDRVTEALTALAAADASWRGNRADLLEQEGYRVADRAWYDAELKHARSGADDKNPAREIALDKDRGIMVLDAVDAQHPRHKRPRLKNAADDANRPLVSLDEYQKRERQQLVALADAGKKLQDLIEETNRQIELLIPEKGKGLRQRIEDEKVKITRADEELAILKPLLVNTAVESELILRRRQMLEARIKELSGVGVASGASRP